MNGFVFLVASVILLAAQSALVVRAVNASRSHDDAIGRAGPALDVVWTTLPGLLVLALLAYTMLSA